MADINIDNVAKIVIIDGVGHQVDMSDMDVDIEQVEYNTNTRCGWIRHVDNSILNIGITRFFAFGKFINRWKAVNDPIIMTPEEIKDVAISQINSVRENTLADGFLFGGKAWHTDTVFQIQITAYVSAYASGLLGPSATVNIRSKDNDIVPLNRLQLLQLAGALLSFVGQAYAVSWAAKDQL